MLISAADGLRETRTSVMTETSARESRSDARLRVILLAAAVLALVGVHGAILGYKKLADVDEGYALSIAERLLEGFKLYHGAVSQRGPLMYYGYELMAAITGWDSAFGLRFWALGFAIAHVLVVYWAGARLLSRWAGVVAALLTVYALGFGMPLRDSVALHGETMQLPALMASVVVGALAMRFPVGSSARRSRLFVAGVSLGAAVCIKQTVGLHPLPLILWIALSGHKRRARWNVVAGEVALFVGAVALVPVGFLVHAGLEGTLHELFYYCVTYNFAVHLHPSTQSFRWLGPFFERLNERTAFFAAILFVFAHGAAFAARRVRAAWRTRSAWALGRAYGNRVYLGLHLAIALATASSMSRFFPHYFIQALPFLTLLVAACVKLTFAHRRTRSTARAVTAAFSFGLLFYGALALYFGEKIDGRIAHDALLERLGKYVEAATTPDQRVFVWGFSPWIYTYSHRRPAGRYVFETYVTGFVPWFWEELDVEKKRIVPGSVEALLSDLDREKPELVIDAGSVLLGRPMRAYEKPASWLHDHYCFEFRFAAFDIYRLKAEGKECAVAFFPRSPAPVDFYGGGLGLVMPPLVDQASSRWLPLGEYDKPVWFPGQPTPESIDAIRDLKKEKEDKNALAKLGIKSAEELMPKPPCAEADASVGDER